MYLKNRAVSLAYKLFLVLLAGWGLFLTLGLPRHFTMTSCYYYTTQSNAMCLAFFAAAGAKLVFSMRRGGIRGACTLLPRCKGAITAGITVTMLVYQFLLADAPFAMGGSSLSSRILHLYVPVLVLLDWVLFDEKGKYRAVDPLLWCTLPMAYFLWTIAAAALGVTYYGGERYPYLFLNFSRLGTARVLANVGLLLAAFVALHYLVYGLDRLLGGARVRKVFAAEE